MSKHKRLLLLKSRSPSAYGLLHHCRCCLRHVYTNSLDASEFSISCTGNPFPAIPVNQLLVSAAAFLQIVQMLLVDIHGSSLKGSFLTRPSDTERGISRRMTRSGLGSSSSSYSVFPARRGILPFSLHLHTWSSDAPCCW